MLKVIFWKVSGCILEKISGGIAHGFPRQIAETFFEGILVKTSGVIR